MFIRVGDNTNELVSKEHVESSNHNANDDNESAFMMWKFHSDSDVDTNMVILSIR